MLGTNEMQGGKGGENRLVNKAFDTGGFAFFFFLQFSYIFHSKKRNHTKKNVQKNISSFSFREL